MPPKQPQPNYQQIEASADIEIELLKYLSKMDHDTLMKHEFKEGNLEFYPGISEKSSWDGANREKRLGILLNYNKELAYSRSLRDKIMHGKLGEYVHLLHDSESNPVFKDWPKQQAKRTIAAAGQHTDQSMRSPGGYMTATDKRGEPINTFGSLVYGNDSGGSNFFSGNSANSERKPLIANDKDKGCCRIL